MPDYKISIEVETNFLDTQALALSSTEPTDIACGATLERTNYIGRF